MNPSSGFTNVTVNFQRQNQSGDICQQSFFMQPKISFTVHTISLSCLGTGVFGARITSLDGLPLAVVSTQWRDYTGDGTADALMDDEGIATPATTNYFPLLMRGNSGWDSGFVLQNPGSTSNNVTVSYYSQAGAGCGSTNPTILANTIYVINPPQVTCSLPYVGSGRATGSQSLTSIVDHVYGADRDVMSHSAPGGNTTMAVAPLALRNGFDFGHDQWNTDLAIQNASASTAHVTIRLYDGNGAQVYVSPSPIAVNPYGTYVVFPLPVYSGFIGSAWVSADQNIAVSATHATPATSAEDTAFSYRAPNR